MSDHRKNPNPHFWNRKRVLITGIQDSKVLG